MSKVFCYPVLGKGKSLDICKAFAEGCGGEVVTDSRPRQGTSFFFGIDQVSNIVAWRQAKQNRDYIYADNSNFDQCREKYYRISKNRMQPSGLSNSTCERFDTLGIEIKPWRETPVDGNIIVCPQSEFFMTYVVGYKGDWVADAVKEISTYTGSTIVVRNWSRNKKALSSTLLKDLENAHCLVTWSSAAAVTALLNGVPVYVMSADSSAARFSMGSFSRPEYIDESARRLWAGALADNEFTIDEIRQGAAWEWLQKEAL